MSDSLFSKPQSSCLTADNRDVILPFEHLTPLPRFPPSRSYSPEFSLPHEKDRSSSPHQLHTYVCTAHHRVQTHNTLTNSRTYTSNQSTIHIPVYNRQDLSAYWVRHPLPCSFSNLTKQDKATAIGTDIAQLNAEMRAPIRDFEWEIPDNISINEKNPVGGNENEKSNDPDLCRQCCGCQLCLTCPRQRRSRILI